MTIFAHPNVVNLSVAVANAVELQDALAVLGVAHNSIQGAPVDVSISHDPFAPEGTVPETPVSDAQEAASDVPEPEAVPQVAPEPVADSEPQDAPEVQPEAIASAGEPVEFPASEGTVEAPGEATNLDTGEVTQPGEPLPEIPEAPDASA